MTSVLPGTALTLSLIHICDAYRSAHAVRERPDHSEENVGSRRVAQHAKQKLLGAREQGATASYGKSDKNNHAQQELSLIHISGYGCGAESLFKMCVGNQIGIALAEDVDVESLFTPLYGSCLLYTSRCV